MSPRAGVLVLVLVVAGFYAPVLAGPSALLPVHTDALSPWRAGTDPARLAAIEEAGRPIAADKTLMFHPQLVACLERMRRGEAPLWNPHALCGVPLLAQAVHGALHPPTWLAAVVAPARAYGWIAALQTLGAALFTLVLLRELGISRGAALAGGLAFAFCGFLALRVHWYQIQGASMYLPLALFATERLAHGRGRWGAVAVLAVAVGGSFLAGFPPSSVYLCYACAAWGLLRLGPPRAPRLGRLALGAALGLLVGLPQLLPSAAFASSGESTRRALEPALVRTLGMRPASLVTLAMPNAFGHPLDLRAHEQPLLRSASSHARLLRKPHANHVESNAWVGVAVLVLAGIGLRRVGPARALGLGLVLVGLACALDTDLLLLVLRLPGLATADPRRVLLLASLGFALLAGSGTHWLAAHRAERRQVRLLATLSAIAGLLTGAVALAEDAFVHVVGPRLAGSLGVPAGEVLAHADDLRLDHALLVDALVRLTVTLLAATAALALARRRPRVGAAALVVLAAAELLDLASREATRLPADGYFAPLPRAAELAGNGSGRLVRVHPDGAAALAYPLPPNTGLPAGVRETSGYITLAPRRIERLADLMRPGSSHGVGVEALRGAEATASPLLDLMAVNKVLSSEPLQDPALRPAGRVGRAWLYRRASALPRAYLAPGPIAVVDEADVEALLGRPGFDPHARTVVLVDPDEPGAAEAMSATRQGHAHDSRGTVVITRDEPEAVDVAVTATRAGWLVLADTALPGWRATVDGAPRPIHVANLAFRAVPVPAGRSVVSFRYEAPGWRLGSRGAFAGLAGLAVVLGLAARARRRERLSPAPSRPRDGLRSAGRRGSP